jgi:hypothetical protein
MEFPLSVCRILISLLPSKDFSTIGSFLVTLDVEGLDFSNITYRKYKESAHMSLIDHLINQSSLDISLIWNPMMTVEVKNYHLSSID